ncbi:MAG: RNA methyltransferase [Planctomycetota bacterium]|nr:MAG: RNA methyltransferase [Planctomycetota bacterium]
MAPSPDSDSRASAWRGVEVDIRRAASAGGRADIGRFSLEGTRIFERALEAGVPVEVALVAEGYQDDPSERVRRLIAGLERAGCVLHTVADEVVERLTEGRGNGAILGLVRIPEQPGLAAVLAVRSQAHLHRPRRPLDVSQAPLSTEPGTPPPTAEAGGGEPGTLLVGVEIEDPGNVGAMVRTARASGAVFAAVGITDPFHPKAVRTSMGNLFKGPTLRFATAAPLLAELRTLGVRTLGAVARGGVPLHEAPVDARAVAVFMGSEAFGLPEEVTRAMDALVTIPMAAEVSSLSVNAAAAVFLYELRRRSV